MFSNQKLNDEASEMLSIAVSGAIKDGYDRLGSPIEKMFLEAFFVWHLVQFRSFPQLVLGVDGPEVGGSKNSGFLIAPQFKIEDWRADFLIAFKDIFCAIECDGHKFHDLTKDQAVRDRTRDRRFQALGYSILRFTGSEIHRDPITVAEEVGTFLVRKWSEGIEDSQK